MPDAFQGVFRTHVWEGRVGPPVACTSLWGTASADGFGMVTTPAMLVSAASAVDAELASARESTDKSSDSRV